MRRIVVFLFVLSVPGWSQPAQQQAQPPIVVKVEMPSESVWTTLIKLAIPTVLGAGLGAGLAFYGVRQTNKHHAAENAANRQHELSVEKLKAEIAAEAKSRESRWEFRKDVYSGLIRTICNLSGLFNESLAINRTYLSLHADHPQEMQAVVVQMQEYFPRLRGAVTDFFDFANLSHLATADWLIQRIVEQMPVLSHQLELDPRSPDYAQHIAAAMGNLNTLLRIVSDAGRKDLWDPAEPENEGGSVHVRRHRPPWRAGAASERAVLRAESQIQLRWFCKRQRRR